MKTAATNGTEYSRKKKKKTRIIWHFGVEGNQYSFVIVIVSEAWKEHAEREMKLRAMSA